MKRTHRLALWRAGSIGAALWLAALAAPGQTADPTPLAPPADAEAPAIAATEVPLAIAAPAPRTSLLEQAWLAPADHLDARVARTQRAALELGAWSLDSAARVLVAGDGSADPLERAAAAVELAPDLPVAHMRLARELWLQDGETIGALRAVFAAVRAIARHWEASLWFAGSGLFVMAVALVAGGLIAVLLAGGAALPHAAHDLGHLLPRKAPAFAQAAGLAALLAVPLVLGEGGFGLALALLGVAVVYGRRAQRFAMAVAALGIGLGAYPVMRYAGIALAALPDDPVAQAALSVAHGIPTPVELERLSALAGRDALAARGLAIHERRIGDLARADAIYQQLIASGANDVSVQNNAADVQLALGNTERAIELYGLAARGESPIVLFNLAQAYGRAFRVEELNQTIERAQRAGGDLVARLTALQGGSAGSFVADLPPASALFWSRALASQTGDDLAQEFRDRFATGRLGREPRTFVVVVAALVIAGALFGVRLSPSRTCPRCRERICRRCHPHGASGEVCEGCHTLFFAPEKTDRVLRAARVNELRARERRTGRLHTALSLVVPGAAGLIADRPVRSWLGAFCFALAIAAVLWRDGVVPDPGVAGAVAPVVFLAAASLAGLVYVIAVGSSLAARRQE